MLAILSEITSLVYCRPSEIVFFAGSRVPRGVPL